MMNNRVTCWFSSGAASAVATKRLRSKRRVVVVEWTNQIEFRA